MGELQFPRSSSLCSPRRENQRFSPSWCLRTLAPAKLVKIVGSYTIGNFQRDAVSLLLWRWSVSGRSARIALERRNPSWPAPRRDDKSLRVPDASTLEAGPERSIVHRSLKPLNIMVIVARLRGSLPSADHTVPNRDEHLIVFPEHGLLVNRQKSPGQRAHANHRDSPARVISGPKRLLEIAPQVGKLMAQFRQVAREFRTQLESEVLKIELDEGERKVPSCTPRPSEASTAQVAAVQTNSSRVSPHIL